MCGSCCCFCCCINSSLSAASVPNSSNRLLCAIYLIFRIVRHIFSFSNFLRFCTISYPFLFAIFLRPSFSSNRLFLSLPLFRWHRCKYLICNEKLPRIALKITSIEIIFKGTISFSYRFFGIFISLSFWSLFSMCSLSALSLSFFSFAFSIPIDYSHPAFPFAHSKLSSQWQNEWIYLYSGTPFDLVAFSNSSAIKVEFGAYFMKCDSNWCTGHRQYQSLYQTVRPQDNTIERIIDYFHSNKSLPLWEWFTSTWARKREWAKQWESECHQVYIMFVSIISIDGYCHQ